MGRAGPEFLEWGRTIFLDWPCAGSLIRIIR